MSLLGAVQAGALCTFLLMCATAPADQLVNLGLDLPARGVPDRVSLTKRVGPNGKVVFADLEGPGCIRRLCVVPTRQLLGSRETIIRIYFDDAKVPHVEAPVGDFFGVMHGRDYYDLNSAFLSVKAVPGYTCYFPMPFAKNARIEFEAGSAANQVYFQCDWTRYPDQELKEPQRFFARWRRENPTERYGRDFLMLDADGPGRLVGFVYGVRLIDNADRWSHGGSENMYIDGEGDVPAFIRGIGGEDTFGVGYGALHPPDSHLYAGMPYYTHEDTGEARPAQRLVGYRFFVHDTIHFQKSLHLRFGCMSNDICSTVYWYQTGVPRPFVKLPSWNRLLPASTVARADVDLPLPDSGSWKLAGVFRNAGDAAMHEPTAAERDPSKVEWMTYAALHGFVDLGHVFRPVKRGVGDHHEGMAAVARATIEAPDDGTVKVRLAWDDHLVLRVNGDKPIDLGTHKAFRPHTVEIPVRKGRNEVLVKLSNTRGTNHGGWVFAFRATTAEGMVLVPRAIPNESPK